MTSHMSFEPNEIETIISRLREANTQFTRQYPGESDRRQPVQTVYGGAHLFKADSARKLGESALRSLNDYAPDSGTLAKALGIQGGPDLAQKIYDRILEKLQREPVEDFRLDFEDGYG